jgi:hypothetical protein
MRQKKCWARSFLQGPLRIKEESVNLYEYPRCLCSTAQESSKSMLLSWIPWDSDLATSHCHQTEKSRSYSHQDVLVAWTQITALLQQQTPSVHNHPETDLDILHPTLGHGLHIQHLHPRTRPIEICQLYLRCNRCNYDLVCKLWLQVLINFNIFQRPARNFCVNEDQNVYFHAAYKFRMYTVSLVSTVEELLGRKSSGSGLESREYGRGDPLRWPRDTPLSAKVGTNFDKWRSLGRYSSLAD